MPYQRKLTETQRPTRMDAKHYRPTVPFRNEGIHIRDIVFDTSLQPKSLRMFLKAEMAYKTTTTDKGHRFQNLGLIASLEAIDIPTAQKRIKPLVDRGYVWIEKRRHEASVYYLCPVFYSQAKLARHRKKLLQQTAIPVEKEEDVSK